MKVQLHGVFTEDGAGGFSLGLFNTSSDALAYQIERNGGKVADFENDPYGHGYREEVALDLDSDGKLDKPAHWHFGQ